MNQELEQSKRRLIAAAGQLELSRDSAAILLTEERLLDSHESFIMNFEHIARHISERDLETIQAALIFCQATGKLAELNNALEA